MTKNTPLLVLGAAAVTGLAVALKGWIGGRATNSVLAHKYGYRLAWRGVTPPADWRPAPQFTVGQKVRIAHAEPGDQLNSATVHTVLSLQAEQLVERTGQVDAQGEPVVIKPEPMPTTLPALSWNYVLDGHPQDQLPVWPGPGPVPPEQAANYQSPSPLTVAERYLVAG
jgi:hypothetical protein